MGKLIDYHMARVRCRWCGAPRHPDDHAGCSRCGNAWPDQKENE